MGDTNSCNIKNIACNEIESEYNAYIRLMLCNFINKNIIKQSNMFQYTQTVKFHFILRLCTFVCDFLVQNCALRFARQWSLVPHPPPRVSRLGSDSSDRSDHQV
jgi:hypothetical protein